jgi:hypothetical protein
MVRIPRGRDISCEYSTASKEVVSARDNLVRGRGPKEMRSPINRIPKNWLLTELQELRPTSRGTQMSDRNSEFTPAAGYDVYLPRGARPDDSKGYVDNLKRGRVDARHS